MTEAMLINADCLEALSKIPNDKIDLVLTDIKTPRLIQFNYSSADFAA